MRCGLVVPAAGSAERLGRADKTLFELAGRPALEWVLDAFVPVDVISEVAIAVSDRNRGAVRALATRYEGRIPIRAVAGGATRQASVASAVCALSPDIELIVIHDAARPLVTPDLIRATIDRAIAGGAAIAAIPVTDTVKNVVEGMVSATVDRSNLWAAQTPQAFRREWLLDAYDRRNLGPDATDESTLIERAGYPVHIVAGSPENVKITTPVDLLIARVIAERRLRSGTCCE